MTRTTQDHPNVIELDNVTRVYTVGNQQVKALSGVDITLSAGNVVSLVGPSGAGKSTLLHMLGALDSPDSGTVTFQGRDITRLTEREQAELRLHRIGFVFQFFNLLPTMSAWENVALPRLLDGSSLKSAEADALRLLTMVGLAGRAQHRPAELSGGQMQRVAIARALVMNPVLLLADEPTGNLDSATGRNVMDLLTGFAHEADASRVVVIATHDIEAAATTDRTIQLLDGTIRADSVRDTEMTTR